MSDTIDTLEIEVESSAEGAIKSLKSLRSEMESFGNSLKSVMGDMSRFGMKDAFSKETKQIQTVAKGMADSLIQQWNIADKEVQSKVHNLCKDIAKQFGSIDLKTGMMQIPDSAITSMEALSGLIEKNGAEATGAAQEYEKFYNTVKGISKIYVPKSVKGEFGGDYASMARTMPGLFTTQEKLKKSAIELDSVYQDLSQQFPHILPQNIGTEAQQFEAIINAVRRYREERNKLTPLDANDIGLQADVMDSVIDKATDMNKALVQLNQQSQGKEEDSVFSGLKKDISGINSALKTVNLDKIQEISSILSNLKTDGDLKATGMVDSVTRLARSVGMFKSVKPSDFDRIVKSINKMGGINLKGITNASGAIRSLAGSLSALKSVVPDGNLNIKVNANSTGKRNTNTSKTKPKEANLDSSNESVEVESDKIDTLSNSADNAKGKIASLIVEINELKEKIKGMESGEIEFFDDSVYEDAILRLKSLEKEYNILKQSMQNAGSSIGSFSPAIFGSLKNFIPSNFLSVISKLKNGIGSITFAGIADKFLGLTSGAKQIASSLQNAGSSIGSFKAKIQDTFSVTNILSTVFSKVGSAVKSAFSPANFSSGLKTLTSGMKSLLKYANPLVSVLGGIKKSLTGTGNSMQYSANKGNFLGRALHFVVTQFKFMMTYRVLGVALQSVGEAMGILAQRSSVFNSRLSQLIASCRTLGANIAALAVPLVNTFGPALTYIINLLSTAISYINQFLSAFTGKTYTVATAGNYDYAASLDSAGSSASDANDALKEYQKTIMGFDELNVMNSQPDDSGSGGGGGGGGGGGASPGFDYSEMEINPAILEMVEKIKEIAGQIFDPMQEAWENKGKAVIEAWKGALDSVKQLAIDIGSSFLEVWTNGTGQEFCENILDLVIDIGDAVNVFAKALDDAWNDGGAGTAYVQSIFDSFNAVLDLIHSINRSLISVFSNGSGKEMFSSILSILTNINKGIENLADRFREAWDAGGIGTKIIQNIADILNIVLDYAESVSKAFRDWTETVDFTGFLNGLNEVLESVKNGNFERVGIIIGNGITAVLQSIDDFITWSKVKNGLSTIAKTIADFLNGVLKGTNWNQLGKTFADAFNLIINTAYTFVTTFNWKTFGTAIGDSINGFLHNVEWGKLGKTFSNFIKGVLETIWQAKERVDWVAFGEAIGETLANIDWLGILVDVAGFIVQSLCNAIEIKLGILSGIGETIAGKLKEVFKNTNFRNVATEFLKCFESSLVGAVAGFAFGGPVGAIIGAITTTLVSAITSHASDLYNIGVSLIEGILNGISDAMSGIASWIDKNIVSPFVEIIPKSWDELKEDTKKAWESIKKNVIDPAKELKEKASEKVSSLVSDGKKKWDEFKQNTSKTWTDAKKTITDAADNFKSKASEKIGALVSDGKSKWDDLKTQTASKWSDIKKSISDNAENAKSSVSTIASNIKQGLSDTFGNINSDASSKWSSIKTSITDNFNNAKSTASTVASNLKTSIADVFSNLKSDVSTKWSNIKTSITNSISEAKSTASSTVGSLKSSISSTFGNILSSAKTTWNSIKDGMVKPIESAKSKIKSIVDTVKGFFNFTFKWPHVPLPHFAISPKGWSAGDLLKGKIPKLSIEWYADGGILNGAQIFGMMGNKMLGGGEAGAEAVLPLKELWKQMKEIFDDLFQKYMNGDELEPALRNIADSIKSSISTKTTITFSGIKDTVTDSSLKSIIEQFMDKWDIPDPSQWDIPDVEQIVEMMKNFKFPTIQDFVDTYKNVILPEMENIAHAASDIISDYIPSGSPATPESLNASYNRMVEQSNAMLNNAIEKMRQSEESDMESLMYQMGESVYENVRAAIASTQGNNNSQSQAPVVEVIIKCDSETLYRSVKKGEKTYSGRYRTVETI